MIDEARSLATISAFALSAVAWAQEALLPPANGPRRSAPGTHRLIGATVHVSPGQTISSALIVVTNGVIAEVRPIEAHDPIVASLDPGMHGASDGSRNWDYRGMHVYAGFIDAAVEVETPALSAKERDVGSGRHWSDVVTPDRSALDGVGVPKDMAEALRTMGFCAAGISPVDPGGKRGGVFRGLGAVVALSPIPLDRSDDRPTVYSRAAYHALAFETSRGEGADDSERWSAYPTSTMGAIALIRQTLSDADWYEGDVALRHEAGSLASLWRTPLDLPLVVDVTNELDALRALRIGVELNRNVVVLGSGLEYRRLGAIRSAIGGPGAPRLIIPLSYPKAPDVSSVGRAEDVDLRRLYDWEQAPTNPRRLEEAGVSFALTSGKVKERGDFAKSLRRAIDHGLSPDAALASLTTMPAQILGVHDRLGTVAPGFAANLVVADRDLFVGTVPGQPEKTKDARVLSVWIDGVSHEVHRVPADLAGLWNIEIPGAPPVSRGFWIEGEPGVHVVHVRREGKSVKARATIEADLLSVVFDHEPLDGQHGLFTMSGAIERSIGGKADHLVGTGTRPDGARFDWRATRIPASPAISSWRVIEADGVARDLAGADGLTLDITPVSVRLTFTKDKGEPTVIDATDVQVRGERVTFKHTIEKLGGKGSSSDTLTVVGNDLIGESTLEDGTKHSYKARREPGKEKTPKINPAFVGWYVITKDEGNDAAERGEVFITSDGRVFLRRGGVLSPTKDVSSDALTITFNQRLPGGEGDGKVSATLDGTTLRGTLTLPDGTSRSFEGTRRLGNHANPEVLMHVADALPTPVGGYGVVDRPARRDMVISHATVWTCGSRGVIEDASIVVGKGRILFVGTASDLGAYFQRGVFISQPWAEVDGTGLHVTPGLIDCHSHTGLSSTNEFGQSVTAEVRIEDVSSPDDANWYRQLAGGITTVNTLHGSANAIGGQTFVQKLRWGCTDPREMRFAEAPPGIKFALGENPKNSNEGTRGTARYPQTRMGVEAIIRDRLTAARAYASSPRNGKGARRDLELEALAEILAGTRLLHCHSYRQDEILMLARVARDFGFRIGTYQHILEGYKVADLVRDSSGGASAFADWWAYKIEVQDAIPQGPPMMHRAGVLVSYNSDDHEMARRMNTEAAKAMKYGGLSPEESLNFVTINPAKQLKIDAHVGSIEPGKDADLAIWSGSPLSSLSRCVATYVEGVRMFSLEDDLAHRARIRAERERIIQRLLRDTAGGGKGGEEPKGDKPSGMLSETYLRLVERGIDPKNHKAGECGCGGSHQ